MSGCSLSICIPTHNFGEFIEATLESVTRQLVPGVEVVVLDGASTDNTGEIVARFQGRFPNVRYVRQDYKGGIDADIARTVELARGDYCWLFSSDDLMREGAVKKVLRHIKSGRDIYLCRHSNCTLSMRLIDKHPLLSSYITSDFDLSCPEERNVYFELARNTEAFFSFMSVIILKRSKWFSVQACEEFMGSCWGHAARIFKMLPDGLTVRCLDEVLMDRRSGNDSFLIEGVINRFRIGIEGYSRMGKFFWGPDSAETYHIKRALRAEYKLTMFLQAKFHCLENPALNNIHLLNDLYDEISIPGLSWSNLLYKYVPGPALSMAGRSMRFLRRLRRRFG